MAAWKIETNDSPSDDDDANSEAAPLFGNFRRSASGSDGMDKPKSMSEMWGFGDENERREARRRRFWQLEQPEGTEEEPWEPSQGSRPPETAEPEPEPEPVFMRAPEIEEMDEPEEQFASEPVIPETYAQLAEASEPEPGETPPAIAPVAPSGGGRNGWRSFLADVPPAVERPMVPLPKLGEPEAAPADSKPRWVAPDAVAPEPERDESVTRLARRLASGSVSHPLVIETSVQLESAVILCTQLGRSWGAGFEPTVADIAIRALARALQREPALKEIAKGVTVLDLGAEQGVGCLLELPANRPFKDTVGDLAAMDAAPMEEIDVSVTDYGLLNIERATPRLAPGAAARACSWRAHLRRRSKRRGGYLEAHGERQSRLRWTTRERWRGSAFAVAPAIVHRGAGGPCLLTGAMRATSLPARRQLPACVDSSPQPSAWFS